MAPVDRARAGGRGAGCARADGPALPDRTAGARRLLALSCLFLALLAFGFPAAAGAVTASWSFSPLSFDFGGRSLEEGRSGLETFVLTDTGTTSLEPALVTLVPNAGDGFELRGNSCYAALEPGESCEVNVAFYPRDVGRDEATLEVSERSSSVAPARATLTGAGAAPVVAVDPPELAFGATQVRAGSGPRSVTVTDLGPGDLHFSAHSFRLVSGPGGEPFHFNSIGCQVWTVLHPGGSCSFSIAFGPALVGPDLGELLIADDGADSPQAVRLSGTAEPEGLQAFPTPLVPAAANLTRRPARRTKARTATFAFLPGDSSTARFQCSLGGGPLVKWCRSPVRYRSLNPGRHLFRLRPVGGDEVLGPVLKYRWRIVR